MAIDSSITAGAIKSCKGWKRLEPDRIEVVLPLELESEEAFGVPIPDSRPKAD
jgi:hypothetical protein